MSSDIGYLQIKIRELEEKIEELNKKVENSLDREKRFKQDLKGMALEIEQLQIKTIEEIIEKYYKEDFKIIFDNHFKRINEISILMGKGWNKAVDANLKEIILLKKDISFLQSLFSTKFNIKEEEMEEYCKSFDKIFPIEEVVEKVRLLKMKYFKEEEVKKILNIK